MFAKRISGAVCLLVILVTTGVQAAPTVVDYYNELRAIKHLELRHPLNYTSGEWTTINQDWNTPMPAIVDTRNGYIFFSDEGTGGGNFETQIVLWRLADGSPLIGIAETSYDPPWPDGTRLRFFQKIAGEWMENSGYVWPGVDMSDFLTSTMTVGDLRAVRSIRAAIYYKLPRKSSTVEAYLVIKDSFVQAVCRGDDSIHVADRAPYLRYCDTLGERLHYRFDLLWDKSEGRFRQGNKSPSRLPIE